MFFVQQIHVKLFEGLCCQYHFNRHEVLLNDLVAKFFKYILNCFSAVSHRSMVEFAARAKIKGLIKFHT